MLSNFVCSTLSNVGQWPTLLWVKYDLTLPQVTHTRAHIQLGVKYFPSLRCAWSPGGRGGVVSFHGAIVKIFPGPTCICHEQGEKNKKRKTKRIWKPDGSKEVDLTEEADHHHHRSKAVKCFKKFRKHVSFFISFSLSTGLLSPAALPTLPVLPFPVLIEMDGRARRWTSYKASLVIFPWGASRRLNLLEESICQVFFFLWGKEQRFPVRVEWAKVYHKNY